METGHLVHRGRGHDERHKASDRRRRRAQLHAAAAKSLIALHGESQHTERQPRARQTLLIESTCGEHAKTTAAASFTNAGTIKLTNGDSCGNNATLTVSSGTLTNNGKITTEVPVGGARTIQGNITNTGTLSINANTAYNGADALLTNEGAINLAEGKQLTVSNGGSVDKWHRRQHYRRREAPIS